MMRLLFAVLFLTSLAIAQQPLGAYGAVEVMKFAVQPGIAFSPDRQATLADDIAREISLRFPGIVILRPGVPPPTGYRELRITGLVTNFKAGNAPMRYIVGFGAGSPMVAAQVQWADASTGKVLLKRNLKGVTLEKADAISPVSGESLATKIAKSCNAVRRP